MAVYISTSTDAFSEVRKDRTREPQVNIRRPLRGIQVKPDTYSVIRVRTAAGSDIPLFDSSSPMYDKTTGVGRSNNYANFLIQSFQESRMEKQQIIETFGEDYVYFFGERPRFISVTGLLLNTADFNWKSEFWANYEQNLRGTRLVEQNARAYFYFDDLVVEGYFVQASVNGSSDSPHMLPFQFQMFVTNYACLSKVGSVFFGISDTGTGNSAEGLAPATHEEMMKSAARAAEIGSNGGLTGFLAKTSQFLNDASLSVQGMLETVKNAMYGRPLVVPEGLSSQVVVPTISYKDGVFSEAPTNQPIHTMTDEYPVRSPVGLDAKLAAQSAAEKARVETLLQLQDELALEAKAREELRKRGVDTTGMSPTMALLGRGAFAAVQYAAPFGLAKAKNSNLSIGDQASGLLLR